MQESALLERMLETIKTETTRSGLLLDELACCYGIHTIQAEEVHARSQGTNVNRQLVASVSWHGQHVLAGNGNNSNPGDPEIA